MRAVLTSLMLLLTLAGCGTATSPAKQPEGAVGGAEPVTPEALAFVAAEHVGSPDSARSEERISGQLGADGVGADLRYHSGPAEDGDSLTVAVGSKTPDEVRCTDEDIGGNGCVRTRRGTLLWDIAGLEEPGGAGVVVRKHGVTVVVFQNGPRITRDPRRLDLEITVEDMFAIATDPRVDLTTSKDAVTSGAALPHWED